MDSNQNQQGMFDITVEQAKLLGSSQRVKIIGSLTDTPKTAKQVADELGESPGSIHYHIQKLYDGGLIDLVETRTVGGIVEKYYKSKAKWFNTTGPQSLDPALADDYNAVSSTKIQLRLQLTEEERVELAKDFRSLLEKWVKKTIAAKDDSKEYAIGVNLVSTEEASKK
ncbi:helix-turn-helix domain-containing protein [Paenibacillus lactis]|uniref:helix-turn-helix domain-containing protein n=1 Tax=Paenibacillus lactis TaxID=228574 RepID=UPI00367D3FA2